MKLHADKPEQLSVSSYGPGWIAVNGNRYTTSIVLSPSGELRPWAVESLESLSEQHFADLFREGEPTPELLVFGSGSTLRFVRPSVLRPLIDRRIGVETMDTGAACRTYNILASEGRRVMAALLIEP